MPSYRSLAALAVATAVLAPTATIAQESVEPVTVTATRTPQTANDTLASTTIITRDDIEATHASSLPELLGRQQGVEFSQSGGRGKQSSLFIRGTDSDQFTTLIDGVRIGSATTGSTAFETLPLENVERIEIVRGPRSSLYGSNAIGGVIQIFTRESSGPRASVSGGSNDYVRGSAGFGRNGDRGGFSVDASAKETDGFDACDNDPNSTCGDEPDDDGFESRNFSLRGYRQLSSDLEVSGNLLLADTDTEFDGTSVNETEQQQTSGSLKLEWTATDFWQSQLLVGRSTDESENFLDGEEQTRFDTERSNIRWQNDFTFARDHLATIGVDFLRDEIDTETFADFEVDERDTTSVFLQHQWNSGDWDTQVNIRRDIFGDGFDDAASSGEDFDDETTGSLALGYRVTERLRAFGSFGTGFRAPDFNELYFPGFGNPDLDPEESETLELGLRRTAKTFSWEISAYRTRIDDLIATVQKSQFVFEPQNVNEAEIDGIEAGFNMQVDNWRGSLNASLKDVSDGDTGNQLPRRAEETLRASVTHQIADWGIGADVRYEGDRFDDLQNTTELDAYTVVDLRADWRFARDWQGVFKINNATDEDYRLTAIHNRDDRNFLVQVKWQPGGPR